MYISSMLLLTPKDKIYNIFGSFYSNISKQSEESSVSAPLHSL